ncbi:MAG: hypothetical protein MAG453_00632 [Calditrichaeota bacterium]|nr:hypothetical protein [Calditrichota bacterium]
MTARQRRNLFSLRWAVEYAADPAFLGIIEEKIDSTCRRLRLGPFETERIQVAVLSVCADVIRDLLDTDPDRSFRLDMTVYGDSIEFRVRCSLSEVPEGVATGSFRPHGATARALDLPGLAIANQRLDDVSGEFTRDGALTITLARTLPDSARRDPPVWG